MVMPDDESTLRVGGSGTSTRSPAAQTWAPANAQGQARLCSSAGTKAGRPTFSGSDPYGHDVARSRAAYYKAPGRYGVLAVGPNGQRIYAYINGSTSNSKTADFTVNKCGCIQRRGYRYRGSQRDPDGVGRPLGPCGAHGDEWRTITFRDVPRYSKLGGQIR